MTEEREEYGQEEIQEHARRQTVALIILRDHHWCRFVRGAVLVSTRVTPQKWYRLPMVTWDKVAAEVEDGLGDLLTQRGCGMATWAFFRDYGVHFEGGDVRYDRKQLRRYCLLLQGGVSESWTETEKGEYVRSGAYPESPAGGEA